MGNQEEKNNNDNSNGKRILLLSATGRRPYFVWWKVISEQNLKMPATRETVWGRYGLSLSLDRSLRYFMDSGFGTPLSQTFLGSIIRSSVLATLSEFQCDLLTMKLFVAVFHFWLERFWTRLMLFSRPLECSCVGARLLPNNRKP